MAKMDREVLEKYEALMRKDPFSRAFAPLADAYLENQQSERAEAVVRDGVRKHPEFAPGYIIYAKILKSRGQLLPSIELLRKATRLAPDNILAYQLLGDVQLELKKPSEALKAYKMVLFLNPMAQKAKNIVQKLESLSALDFEETTFSFAKLTDLEQMKRATPIEQVLPPIDEKTSIGPASEAHDLQRSHKKALERMLSLIDAFIVRNDLVKASELIEECQSEFGQDAELIKRWNLLRSRGFSSELATQGPEQPVPLKPVESREQQIHKKKIDRLQLLLRKIQELHP